MFENYFNFSKLLGKGILVTGMTVANWFGVVPSDYFIPPQPETIFVYESPSPSPAPVPSPTLSLGATYLTPEVRALFEDSLADKITSSATSMTLTNGTDKEGTPLASSTYGFIIDEGTSVEEFVLADCTGTTCTNLTRGVSVVTGTSTVSSLKFEHRRGASVKITDGPSLIFAINVLKGKQNIENVLRYDTTKTFNNSTDIISRSYADGLAFGAVPAASETASGFTEIATNIETASSTSLGSTGARLSIPASLATSTYNAATAPLKVVVTQNDGKIDSNFIPFSSYTGNVSAANLTITGTSNIASTSIYATTTSGTWVKPANLKYLIVEAVGGGGGGAGVSSNPSTGVGGGGAGGYVKKIIPASALGATETVTIGAAGAGASAGSNNGGDGGNTTFGTYFTAGGGKGGTSTGSGRMGGDGGSATGGDVNINGNVGGNGVATANGSGGNGGNSAFAPGNKGYTTNSDGSVGSRGSGGSGAFGDTSTAAKSGGAGGAGYMVFTYVFY